MPINTDLTTDVGKVRLLIADINDANHIFEDNQVQAFLDMEGTPLWAAARALEVIAASEVMVQKRIQILDLRTDGPAEADSLMKLSTRYRETTPALDDEEAAFEIVGLPVDHFTQEQLFWNAVARGEVF